KMLRRLMERVNPGAFLTGLRGKNVFTQEGFAEDRQRLLNYLNDHGYPEARVGNAEISRVTQSSWTWWAVPHKTTRERLEADAPAEAGSFYRVESVNVSETLHEAAVAAGTKSLKRSANIKPGQPYSQRSIEMLRLAWQARVQAKAARGRLDPPSWISVQAQ